MRVERIAWRGYPTVEQASTRRAWNFDAAFEFGLQLILDGVEATMNRGKANRTNPNAAMQGRRKT
jgi:hypothetical protein